MTSKDRNSSFTVANTFIDCDDFYILNFLKKNGKIGKK